MPMPKVEWRCWSSRLESLYFQILPVIKNKEREISMSELSLEKSASRHLILYHSIQRLTHLCLFSNTHKRPWKALPFPVELIQ